MQTSAKVNDRRIDSKLLDRDLLVQRCMGNHALVERLLTRYMDLVSRDCDLLETALRDEDAKFLAQVAHRLKGTSATVGSSRTCELASLIEQESAAEDWPLLNCIVAEIRNVHTHVAEHYREPLACNRHVDAYGGGE